jgi:hypothetical protein
MDYLRGAAMLDVRIRAGVRVGQSLELLSDSTVDLRLKRGHVGLVRGFDHDGNVVVEWGDGLVAEIDPSRESYSALHP